ncbi:DeoR/GlpR family DNA-binding transcription regulator [Mucilaginibacter sabulilitoris]|uniref:DeoR/GlpR family DNA-binding transcription regulator n=1 Tax=Mucilaginibacter sabulilitoris TaxID=1173583 RepID=A0ABZ0TM10_9SPHI|nr:DeoR/GlpR family DNA-binding transcription regulator [Mucilaginibacter sabulilitoris]WPU93841.1 DeoR/GlpR family DNA-binding transcription regulator [Mucilaginibacter sabulilitoris]
MTKEERFEYILSKLRLNDIAEYAQLSTELGVSEDTIRRDINELAEAGMITKVKGGARPKAIIPATYQEREVYASADKRIIAEKAAKLFKDGQVVVFDGGTTPFLIASFLPRYINITLITHSYPIANLTFQFPNIELVFAGGTASKQSKISTGFDVLKKYNAMHADISILGVHSLHPNYGVTDPVLAEAEVKTRISEMSDRLIVVPTAEKLNNISTIKICKTESIDLLITNLNPDNLLLQPYRKLGIQFL